MSKEHIKDIVDNFKEVFYIEDNKNDYMLSHFFGVLLAPYEKILEDLELYKKALEITCRGLDNELSYRPKRKEEMLELARKELERGK